MSNTRIRRNCSFVGLLPRSCYAPWGLVGDYSGVLIAFPQIRGLERRSWPVGRVLSPAASRPVGGRPSIWARRCRRTRAVYPRARAGRPRTHAVRPCSGRGLPSRPGRPGRWWSLAPPFHPYLPFPGTWPVRGWRSVLCGTFPRVTPGGCCPPPCPAEPGPSSTPVSRRTPRSPGQLLRNRQDSDHRRSGHLATVPPWSRPPCA